MSSGVAESHWKISDVTLMHVLARTAHRCPDRVYVRCEAGEITYGDTKSVNSEYQLISNVQFGKAQASLARRAYRKGK